MTAGIAVAISRYFYKVTPPPAVSLIILLLAIPASIVIYIAADKALMREYEKYVKWLSK